MLVCKLYIYIHVYIHLYVATVYKQNTHTCMLGHYIHITASPEQRCDELIDIQKFQKSESRTTGLYESRTACDERNQGHSIASALSLYVSRNNYNRDKTNKTDEHSWWDRTRQRCHTRRYIQKLDSILCIYINISQIFHAKTNETDQNAKGIRTQQWCHTQGIHTNSALYVYIYTS